MSFSTIWITVQLPLSPWQSYLCRKEKDLKDTLKASWNDYLSVTGIRNSAVFLGTRFHHNIVQIDGVYENGVRIQQIRKIIDENILKDNLLFFCSVKNNNPSWMSESWGV